MHNLEKSPIFNSLLNTILQHYTIKNSNSQHIVTKCWLVTWDIVYHMIKIVFIVVLTKQGYGEFRQFLLLSGNIMNSTIVLPNNSQWFYHKLQNCFPTQFKIVFPQTLQSPVPYCLLVRTLRMMGRVLMQGRTSFMMHRLVGLPTCDR